MPRTWAVVVEDPPEHGGRRSARRLEASEAGRSNKVRHAVRDSKVVEEEKRARRLEHGYSASPGDEGQGRPRSPVARHASFTKLRAARAYRLRSARARFRRRDVLARSHALLDQVDAARTRVGRCSHDMQKRLSFARAPIAHPPMLLVDEATHDLDPGWGGLSFP